MKEPEAEREELLLLLEALVSACETASHPDLLPRSLQQDSHGDYLQGTMCQGTQARRVFYKQHWYSHVLQASLCAPRSMSVLLQPLVPRTFVDTSVLYLRFRPPFLKNRWATTKYLSV